MSIQLVKRFEGAEMIDGAINDYEEDLNGQAFYVAGLFE